jgi:hypothetical protein
LVLLLHELKLEYETSTVLVYHTAPDVKPKNPRQNMKFKIAILCAAEDSTYFDIQSDSYELDIYTSGRPIKFFDDRLPVICHPPCRYWSRMRGMCVVDEKEKQLAFDCFKWVRRNGGILEHPHGSLFMREIIGYENCQSFHQSWFGFGARKSTLLYCSKVKLLPSALSFNLPSTRVNEMSAGERSHSTLEFNKWLCDSVYNSFCIPVIR